MNNIITTSDGSHTLFVPELNEHYHSVNGAVGESMIVFIMNGYEFCQVDPLKILEIGFGTGLNALLTLMKSSADKRNVHYTSIEKYPLGSDMISHLNHYKFAGENGACLNNLVHSAKWNIPVRLTDHFTLLKKESDFITEEIAGVFDLVYFDAFGPDKQPEMWTEDLFSKIWEATLPGSVLVTYSVKGEVKRALRSAGFDIYLLPGPPGKRQVLRAVRRDKIVQ